MAYSRDSSNDKSVKAADRTRNSDDDGSDDSDDADSNHNSNNGNRSHGQPIVSKILGHDWNVREQTNRPSNI